MKTAIAIRHVLLCLRAGQSIPEHACENKHFPVGKLPMYQERQNRDDPGEQEAEEYANSNGVTAEFQPVGLKK